MAPRFLFVANIEAADGNAAVRAGNERVLRARLADAKSSGIRTAHAGSKTACRRSMRWCSTRSSAVSATRSGGWSAWRTGWLRSCPAPTPARCRQAVRLAKADLVTGMVGEFPELQGAMGRYYALGEGLDAEVADALAEHYRPQGPGDEAPGAPVSMVAALSDKYRHAGGVLLHRRTADRLARSVCTPPGGARHRPDRAGKRPAPSAYALRLRRRWRATGRIPEGRRFSPFSRTG